MRLKKEHRKQLYDALLEAFDHDSLRRVVTFQLDETPAAIYPPRVSLTSQVEELVGWAERNERVQDLIAGARRANPGNKKLEAAEAAILNSAVTNPPRSPDPVYRPRTPDDPRGSFVQLRRFRAYSNSGSSHFIRCSIPII